jgi:hypothetical protein
VQLLHDQHARRPALSPKRTLTSSVSLLVLGLPDEGRVEPGSPKSNPTGKLCTKKPMKTTSTTSSTSPHAGRPPS